VTRDLVITLPQKVKWKDYEKELAAVADGSSVMNFRLPGPPRQTAPGARCYVVHNGAVQGHMLIHGVVHRDGFTCDSTGVTWPEGWYVQRTGQWFPVDRMIQVRGFQGFRYAPDEWRK